MIKATFKCENCRNEVTIEVKKLFEVKDALKKLGWFQFSNLTLCPSCRNRPTL